MFEWLFGNKKKGNGAPSSPKKKAAAVPPRHEEASDSVLNEASLAFGGGAAGMSQAAQTAADRSMQQRREQRKVDRMQRREMLFGIVRESMLRTGILSSAYKFKVLSIDQKGRHFLVLLDISMELAQSEPPERFLEIEKMVAENALSRMQVVVQAVYWRYFVPNSAATVRLSTGDTQPGGLTAMIQMGAEEQSKRPHEEPAHAEGSAEAIATALAQLRAKSQAKHAAQEAVQSAAAVAGGASAAGAAVSNFAATQVLRRDQLAGGAQESELFPATQMLASSADAASLEELEAFRRALHANHQAAAAVDSPPSIFVSGKTLDHDEDEDHDDFGDRGLNENLSATQYGALR